MRSQIMQTKFISIVILLSIGIGFGAMAQTKPLLEYEAGFQAGHTKLTILSDGKTIREEMVCCPPTTHGVKSRALTSAELNDFKNVIQKIASDNTSPMKKKNVAFGLGYRNGSLSIYAADGKKMLVEELARHQTSSGDITYLATPAAVRLEKLLYILGMTNNQLEIFPAAN